MSRIPALHLLPIALIAVSASLLPAQAPTEAKAQKTYADALKASKGHDTQHAIDLFRKADKQDGNHCSACASHAALLALQTGDTKLARNEAIELEALAKTPEEQANAHLLHGVAMLNMGMANHKERDLTEADSELQKAIALSGGNQPEALFEDGMALANLHQDDSARARFHEFLGKFPSGTLDSIRAARYEKRPELARQRMAPVFSLTTLSGQQISLDGLEGKVLLIDFWATWCGPCREALPHMQSIAKKFAGQPLVILSVSLDSDQAKWESFVAKNNMTWQQYRDGGFDGPLAQRFSVHAIPATFTIDADGVLQDQHVGDAAIEGKLKKLVAAAANRAEAPPPPEAN
ncbi:MAG TPA: redoxin domain-containing protein [Acidobacteriaceae bacterium]|jgi:thiol-disulfide isomerase/thioredoxin